MKIIKFILLVVSVTIGFSYYGIAVPVEEDSKLLTDTNDFQSKRKNLEYYHATGRSYEDSGSIDSAIWYYQRALKHARSESNNWEEVEILRDLGICHLTEADYIGAQKFFTGQLELIEREELTEFLPACYNNLGLVYYYMNEYDLAIKYYLMTIGEYRRIGKEKELGTSLLNLGILLKDQGFYDHDMEILLEAQLYLKKYRQKLDLASCFEATGNVNYYLKNYKEALGYHRQALWVRISEGYEKGIAKSMNNLGLSFMQEKKYDSALICFDSSLQIRRHMGEQDATIPTLVNIGLVYLNQDDLTSAQKQFSIAFKLTSEETPIRERVILFHHMADLGIRQGTYAKAAEFINLAENWIGELSSIQLSVENLRLKTLLYRGQGKHVNALVAYDEYNALKDSMLNKEKSNFISQIQVLHEVEEKENENAILKKEALVQQAQIFNERQKVFFLIALSILLIAVAGISVWGYLVKKKSSRTVNLMMSELHHRMKNNLQLISSLLGLQSGNLKDKTAIDAVKSSENRVNAMGIIHQLLYQTGDARKIDMRKFMTQIIGYLKKVYAPVNSALKIDTQLSDVEMDMDKAVPLGLIINELISNAFKHALIANKTPQIRIALLLEHHKAHLIVEDNGPGMPQGFDVKKSSSFGLRMVEMLSRQLKATFNIEACNGTRVEILV